MRERSGVTFPFVIKSEVASVSQISQRVAISSTIHADKAASCDVLYQRYLTKCINHQESYLDSEACTN